MCFVIGRSSSDTETETERSVSVYAFAVVVQWFGSFWLLLILLSRCKQFNKHWTPIDNILDDDSGRSLWGGCRARGREWEGRYQQQLAVISSSFCSRCRRSCCPWCSVENGETVVSLWKGHPNGITAAQVVFYVQWLKEKRFTYIDQWQSDSNWQSQLWSSFWLKGSRVTASWKRYTKKNS